MCLCFSGTGAGGPQAVLEGHGGHRSGQAIPGHHPDRDLTGVVQALY